MMRYLKHARPYMSMIDLASLLWRLELRDVDALPWGDVSDYARRHFANGSNVFGEIHLAMLAAAASDSDALGKIRRRLESHRDRGHEGATAGLVWVDALAALLVGDRDAAQEHLDECAELAVRIGGSHAQRH